MGTEWVEWARKRQRRLETQNAVTFGNQKEVCKEKKSHETLPCFVTNRVVIIMFKVRSWAKMVRFCLFPFLPTPENSK